MKLLKLKFPLKYSARWLINWRNAQMRAFVIDLPVEWIYKCPILTFLVKVYVDATWASQDQRVNEWLAPMIAQVIFIFWAKDYSYFIKLFRRAWSMREHEADGADEQCSAPRAEHILRRQSGKFLSSSSPSFSWFLPWCWWWEWCHPPLSCYPFNRTDRRGTKIKSTAVSVIRLGRWD